MKNQDIDNFIKETLDVIRKLASGDFSTRLKISDEKNEIDAVSLGINMLAEELASRQLDVERKIENLENYQEIFEDREIKMIELKKEIDDLRKKYGEEIKYKI